MGTKEQVLYDLKAYVHRKQVLQQKKIARDSYWYGMDGVHSVAVAGTGHNGLSDPTYQQMLRLPAIRKQIDELTQEIDQIQTSLDKIDDAVSQLSQTERIVVQAMYTQAPLPPKHRKTYRILAQETKYAEGTLKNARASALKKLASML